MKRIRVIPVLLIEKRRLVKTVRFRDPHYVGDPINALKVFNEKEVDELVILDIGVSASKSEPDFEYLKALAGECFMPISYGGGITSIEHARKIFQIGVEKIVLGRTAFSNPAMIEVLASTFGSQSVVICIDVKKNIFGSANAYIDSGKNKIAGDVVKWVKTFERCGAGEIILQSIPNDGTFSGYNLELIRTVASSVSIPVVAAGGAANLEDFVKALQNGASAVAAGSMFLYKGSHKGVVINYPSQPELINHIYLKV